MQNLRHTDLPGVVAEGKNWSGFSEIVTQEQEGIEESNINSLNTSETITQEREGLEKSSRKMNMTNEYISKESFITPRLEWQT